MELALTVVTAASVLLVIYHHVLWPLLLRRLAPRYGDLPALSDGDLPPVTLIMPAFNEADFIAEKIRNLSALDYPRDRLEILIACDGCSDDTVEIARRELSRPEHAGLCAQIADLRPNRGILGVYNLCLPSVPTGRIVALTDVTAVLPPDALRRAAPHYVDPTVGAVGGAYCLGPAGYAGETAYWRYQRIVKRGEAALGAPLGMHGAFYTFRREAWLPARPDTVNDDFEMPAGILHRGWKVRYDDRIVAVECEAADPAQDARRRRRIAAGNAQQLARNLWLLDPRRGRIALAFASGKAMRVFMPFIIAVALAGSVALAPVAPFFLALMSTELALFAAAVAGGLMGKDAPRPLALVHYAAVGHLAGLVGVLNYCIKENVQWGTRPGVVASVRRDSDTPRAPARHGGRRPAIHALYSHDQRHKWRFRARDDGGGGLAVVSKSPQPGRGF
jgi:cellulose synthase/poly-beta-1,6-N-acetylglucosamine synthase-like glycosyltransferase